MGHELDWRIETFTESGKYHVDSYKPGKHRLYAAWHVESGRQISLRLTAREMEAWLDGWFTAHEEISRERNPRS